MKQLPTEFDVEAARRYAHGLGYGLQSIGESHCIQMARYQHQQSLSAIKKLWDQIDKMAAALKELRDERRRIGISENPIINLALADLEKFKLESGK